MTRQGVGIQDGIGKSEWWWFRLEIWGGNNKRKHWAKVCKILLRLLTILKCEFRESPLTGKNLMKVMRGEGLSNERPPGTGFSVFVGGGRGGTEKTLRLTTAMPS